MSKKKRKRTWIKRSLLIAGAVGIVIVIVRALIPNPVDVDVAIAAYGPLDVEIREDGQTRVRERFVVAASIGGELERITAVAGAPLDRDQVLARIAPPKSALLDDRTRDETRARLVAAQARERQAQTAIAQAQSQRDQAARDAKRSRELAAQGAVPITEAEQADLAAKLAGETLAAAEYQRTAAASEIRALHAVLSPRTIPAAPFEVRSPIRGRVLRVFRESAGPVAAGTPLVEVGDPASLEVVVDVLSRDAERIAPGMPVDVETAGAKPIRGNVVRVEPSAFTKLSSLGVEEQRVNVVICFDGPPSIGDAFRVDARIITWHGDRVLRVPAGAVFRDHGRSAVYVIDDDRAKLRPVVVGHRGRTEVEITEGLAAGDHVVVHPGDSVNDDTRVKER